MTFFVLLQIITQNIYDACIIPTIGRVVNLLILWNGLELLNARVSCTETKHGLKGELFLHMETACSFVRIFLSRFDLVNLRSL